MLKPFVITTIVFIVIGVHGEIDNKFELLVPNRTNLEDIYKFLKIKLFKKHCF
jgi:hypothetical protein